MGETRQQTTARQYWHNSKNTSRLDSSKAIPTDVPSITVAMLEDSESTIRFKNYTI